MTDERDLPDLPDLPDPAEQERVRALLAEVGRTPEPLPADVAARLDDTLADLVADLAAERGTTTVSVVVPLDRARRRRRRTVQTLVAAAAVVVGGYAVTTAGLTGVSDDSADSAGGVTAMDEPSGAEGAAGGAADPGEGAFALASDTLRADARRLVSADTAALQRSQGDVAAPSVPLTGDSARVTQDELDAGKASDGSDTGVDTAATPTPLRGAGCLDPDVPVRLTRLAVTYDGRAATAVVRPLRPAADGSDRVRVEVWDCFMPSRLAAVVVRR